MVNVVFKTQSGEEIPLDLSPEGSLMEAAIANGVPGITADCGGSMVCGTCHVMVDPKWQAQLPEQSDMERDILEYVPQPQANTRLSCQIPVTEDIEGIVLLIPESQY